MTHPIQNNEWKFQELGIGEFNVHYDIVIFPVKPVTISLFGIEAIAWESIAVKTEHLCYKELGCMLPHTLIYN